MDNIRIEPTKSTPLVEFDFARHHLLLQGESYPENATAFYSGLLDSLETYLKEGNTESVTFDVNLLYFNSSSTKALFRIFDLLQSAQQNGVTVRVNWFHHAEDLNTREFGEDFQEDFPTLNIHLCREEES